MKGEVTINGKDAFTAWGICFTEQAISNLMLMPPPLKSYTTNGNAGMHGVQVLGTPMVNERDVSLELHIIANTREQMFLRLRAFTNDVLKNGTLKIKTKYSNDIYTLIYLNCSQISSFNGKIAKFLIRCTEPNPNSR